MGNFPLKLRQVLRLISSLAPLQALLYLGNWIVSTRDVRGGAFSSGAGRGGATMKIRGAVRGGAGRKSA